MHSNNKLNQAVRLALALGVTTTALFANSVSAQETTADNKVERIEVTGSKIKRIGELSPTPVTVISGDMMVDAGITNVGELMSELPSAVVGLSPETTNNSIFANGLSQTALRGLGSNRTLVLVNGRRFVGSNPGNSAVDLNNIPAAMIARIEITTGGASAVYGSDAVAGVVNIVTKKSFEGFEADVATSRPSQKGGEEDFYSLTFGSSEGKSDFIANMTYVEQSQVTGAQRDFIRNGLITIDNPLNKNGTDGIPGRIVWDQTGNPILRNYGKTGWFNVGGVAHVFNADGSVRPADLKGGIAYPFVLNSAQNSRYLSAPDNPGDGYNTLEHTYLRTPLERLNLSANWSYQINDDHRFSFESTYSNSKAFGESSPAFFVLSGANGIDPLNPMLTDATRKFFADNKVTTQLQNTYLAANFGNRKYDQNRSLVRVSLGLEGNLTETWGYESYVQKGHVDANSKWFGEMLEDNFYAAIQATRDGTGKIVCKDVAQRNRGCVPLNIYGSGLESQEALDWVRTDAMRDATLDQDVAGLTVSGDVYELPAGIVGSAFSLEYRKERTSSLPDPAMRSGALFNNQSAPMSGEFSVTEASAEFSIPLFAELFLVKDLTLETAFRTMDYSTTGRENAWKISLNHTITDELKLRLNRSKSVRAPNIGELYNPPGQTFTALTDPCQQLRIDSAGVFKTNVEKNCRADGMPQGWSPTNAWITGGSKPGFIIGNEDLSSEQAYDITAGIIYTPEWLDGFSVTADYWKFDISNMIQSHGAQNVVNYCYQLDSLDNPYCALFTRDPATRDITNYFVKPVNSASASLAGVDVETNYKFELGSYGKLDLRLMATYTDNWEQNTTGRAGDSRSFQGQYGTFRWKGRFTANYTYEDLAVALGSSYLHHSVFDRSAWTAEVNNYNEIASYTTWDLTSRYNVTPNLTVRAGVLNLADRQPVRNPNVYNSGEHYDILGRRLTVGVNYKF
ncbi:TonB-dependent receptor [Rheinheimera riviphila]|uniref:TonB-dependent receptor n=2 Tax=Rheinheimera riviphila TaxID=1834037 RepID=A0A437QSB9_9GAMM|nr:TonB-dependent receptor [Rheinheimera riviphila]